MSACNGGFKYDLNDRRSLLRNVVGMQLPANGVLPYQEENEHEAARSFFNTAHTPVESSPHTPRRARFERSAGSSGAVSCS